MNQKTREEIKARTEEIEVSYSNLPRNCNFVFMRKAEKYHNELKEKFFNYIELLIEKWPEI
ncbi:MAG: hypothetical protein AABY22_21935 [Nanoarchaeota archaeon]